MHIAGDVKYAFRTLRNNPGFTAVAVGTLALGIAANTVVFTGIESFLLRPLPLKNPERLVFIHSELKKSGDRLMAAYPDLLDWKAGAPAFDNMAGMQIDTFNITGRGDAERVRGARVTADFFPVLGLPAELGRTFTAEEDRPGGPAVVLVSHSYWTAKLGGNPQVIGTSVVVDGSPRIIVGVMPKAMTFPPGFSELWVPVATSAALTGRGNHFLSVLGRLKEGASIEKARAQLSEIAARIEREFPGSNKDVTVRVTALQEQLGRQPGRALIVLFVTVVFVLLICCGNIANLLMARAAHRKHEMAIRTAVGAARWDLFRQVLAESVVLSGLGGLAGLLLGWWGVDALRARLPDGLQPFGGFTIDGRVLAFCAALSIGTGLLFGAIPAFQLMCGNAVEALRESGRSGRLSAGRSRLAGILVAGEIAAAALLLIGAGLLIDALKRMETAEIGYDPRNVLTAELAPATAKYRDPAKQGLLLEEILRRLDAVPGAKAVAAVNWPPMTNDTVRAYAAEGTKPADVERPATAGYRVATSKYAQAMGIRVLRGRFISDSDRWTTEPVAVVNQRLAEREWPGQNPIGRRLAMYDGPKTIGKWRTVVGVVGDVRHGGPASPAEPEIYLPLAQEGAGQVYLAIRTAGDPAAFALTLQSVVKSVDPDVPLNLVRPMARVIADGLAPTRMVTRLLTLFSIAALLLAAMGLYGVMSYVVARRTHEFGVRLALGATYRDLLRLVFRRAAVLTAFGVGLGSALPVFLTASQIRSKLVLQFGFAGPRSDRQFLLALL